MTAPRGKLQFRPKIERVGDGASSAARPAEQAVREVTHPVEVPPGGAMSGLELLLGIEQLARQAGDLTDLAHLIVNETRKLNRARQIFLVELAGPTAAEVRAVSGVSTVDPNSMLIDNIRKLIAKLLGERPPHETSELTLPAYCEPDWELASTYPFRELAWVPLLSRQGVAFAGMLMARETVWSKDDLAISRRLGGTYAHAWRELKPVTPFASLWTRAMKWRAVAALAVGVGLCVPVPVTALAPVEIVALEPAIVSAPIDGVIDAVAVEPNAPVKAGDVLLKFSDTTLRNRRDIAGREVAVAEARVRQLTMLAFGDSKGRHELGLAEAELELKRSELAYAADLLDKTILRAQRDGVVVYPDRKMLMGKPVSTGERLMEIAEPSRVEARIDVAAADVIALRIGGPAKLFLDVDPLRPLSGSVARADFKARPSDSDVLAFRAFAALDAGGSPTPRIGLRGTAQIQGDTAPLAVVLLRRPISAARQWLGL